MTYRLHDIEEIEGIGPARATVLRRRGIHHTEDLLRYDVGALMRMVERIPGFPAARMGAYRAHASLMQVPGLTYQFAEALCWAQRRGLSMLASPQPRAIVADVERARAANVLNEAVSEEAVLRWQKRAIAIDHTAKVAGLVLGAGRQPLAGAVARVGQERAETAADGRFWIPVAPYGKVSVTVSAPGYRTYTGRIVVRPGPVPVRAFTIAPGADPVRRVDEAAGGFIARVTPDHRRAWVPTPVSALPEGAPLWFSRRLQDGRAILHGVHRKQVGLLIEIPRVTVPPDWVEEGTRPGTVFLWQGGRLERSDETVLSIRMRMWLGPAARFILQER
jgi:Carboxypeptidase regulatory-like domain/Domain of unknown function (DUF4332)